MRDFPIFTCDKFPEFDDGEGILGLRPAPGEVDKDSFLEQLADKQQIEKPIFSVFVTNDYYYTPLITSQIRFGGYNNDVLDQYFNTNFDYFKLNTFDTWALTIYDAKYNDYSYFSRNIKTVEFNPGTPYITMPKTEFDRFVTEFRKSS